MSVATIATWNVNSIRVRLPQVVAWLETHRPAVLALQETKVADEDFPAAPLTELGYEVTFSGEKAYNGVALVSRSAAGAVETRLPGLENGEKRLLAATFGEWRIVNVYVPNGTAVGHERYAHKLRWLGALRQYARAQLTHHEKLVILGDFNIAPGDADVHDPAAWAGEILCSDGERQALQELLAVGLEDVFRRFPQAPDTFSWWDYRTAAFRGNRGLRIDLVLTSNAATAAARACRVDPGPRAGARPSDHAPVVLEVEDPATGHCEPYPP